MATQIFLAVLTVSSALAQDRYWGSYSAVYPAGGSGSSGEVAFDVASLQEASRQALTASAPLAPVQRASAPRTSVQRTSAPRATAPKQQSFGQPNRPGGYVHNPAGDAGQPYVHDTTGDHGPYYYWKLRQQAKSGVAAPATTAPAAPAAPAPQRQIVTVRKQRPAAQPPVFANFQAAPAAPAAPARQQYFQPAPAPVRQAPAPVQNYFQPQAPAYQVDFNQRAYAYTAPTYSAQAQGTSYSYEAQY